MKVQTSIQTIIFVALILAIALIVIAFLYGYLSVTPLSTTTFPFVISQLNIYNFTENTQGSCNLAISFIANQNINLATENVGFMLSNGGYLYPSYTNYSISTSVLPDGEYLYDLAPKQGFYGYNVSICSFMSQASKTKNNYITGITRIINGKTRIVQTFLNKIEFLVNTPNTNPSAIFNKNIIGTTATHSVGAILITGTYNNTQIAITAVPGEYVYLPTGNYSIEYLSEGSPAIFLEWASEGGISIQNPVSQATNMTVINNGELLVDNYLSLAPPQQFTIITNQTYTEVSKSVNVTALYVSGYYTFYVNNIPYKSCIDIQSRTCFITEAAAETYNITATFKNATSYAVSNLLQETFYNPLTVSLSGSYSSGTTQLTADASGGYGPLTYSFYYSNGTAVSNCQNIASSTCSFPMPIKTGSPITIKNPASIAFDGPNGAQVYLTPNLKSLGISSPISNDRFFEGSTELYGWCENNCSTNVPDVWVNIPGGINAGQTITISLNGSISKQVGFYVIATDSSGSAKNSTTITAIGASYSTWGTHMGNKTIDNDIAKVMNPGLVYNSYYNSSYSYYQSASATPSIGPIYSAPLQQNTVFQNYYNYQALANYVYGLVQGTTQNYDYYGSCQSEPYVIFNNQTYYSCGNSVFNGYPYSSLGEYGSWFAKAIGWIVISSPTPAYITGDDAVTLGISNYSSGYSTNWLGSSNNVTDLASGWKLQPAATYSGNIATPGTYRIELLYFENGASPSYFGFFTTQQAYYYSPTPYPDNIAPIITYNSTSSKPEYILQTSSSGYVYGDIGSYYGGNNPFSVNVWVNISSNYNGPIIGITSSPPGSGWNMPFISESGMTIYGSIWDNNIYSITFTESNPGWHMITFTYNSSNSQETLYIDGEPIGTMTYTYTPSGTTDYWTTYISGAKPSGINNNYNGQLVNVQFYNKVLTQAQISTLFNAGLLGHNQAGLTNDWLLQNNLTDSVTGNSGTGTNYNFINIAS
ncbi:MAG: LamG domain-containing protein [Candidatus Parvarchaeota archaeon]